MSRFMRQLWQLFRPRPTPTPTPPAETLDMHSLHNAYREERGLTPLGPARELQLLAQQHAIWMAEHKRLSHGGFGVPNLRDRLLRTGFVFSVASENIAEGQGDAVSCFEAWLASPGHKRNITGPFRYMGWGVAMARDGTIYWCVVFAG